MVSLYCLRRAENFSYSALAWSSALCLLTLPAWGKHLALVETQELVQLPLPVLHEYLLAPPGLILGIVQPHDHDAVQFVDLMLVEIILGDGHIGFAHLVPLPGGQPHVGPTVSRRGSESARPQSGRWRHSAACSG